MLLMSCTVPKPPAQKQKTNVPASLLTALAAEISGWGTNAYARKYNALFLEKSWDADGNFVDEHALTAAISRVRNKIETPDRQYIKTVYGMGYMWIGGALK